MNRHSNSLQTTCLQTIREYAMLVEGDCVAVGLSGGADSVALLHFLCSLRASMHLQVYAVHINHQLRGEESDRDEAFVRALCERWAVPLTVERLDIGSLAEQRRQSVELCAREERYRVFARTASDGKIATAHNQNDNAETTLLNLVRGTALRGLCGIPPVRGRVIRPLIGTSRQAVEAYCKEQGLSYVTDSTNHSDQYTRNRLRHTVLPLLEQENPAFLRTVSAMTETLRQDADYLDGLAQEALAELRLDRHTIRCEQLKTLDQPVRLRVLRLLLDAHAVPVERRRLRQMDALLETGGSVRLCAQWYCRCTGDALAFLPAKEEEQSFSPVWMAPPFFDTICTPMPGKTLRISIQPMKKFEKNENYRKNQFKNVLDCDKIDKIIIVRQRLPGDRIRLAGRGCTKTIRKLLQEAKPAPEWRRCMLLLADEEQVLWAEGFGVDESVQVDAQTRRVMILETETEKGADSGERDVQRY